MLDLIFYPAQGEPPHYIELSEDFYEWLAKGNYPSKNEYQTVSYKLRKLQELRKCLENENYLDLQRVV